MSFENPFTASKAASIWPKNHTNPNQYIQFRQEFTLSKSSDFSGSMLHISTDTAYALWINGGFVHSAQFHDWPDHKTFDSLDIAAMLVEGKNVICILAYYLGADTAQYVKSDPRLVYTIRTGTDEIVSGPQTQYRPSSAYKMAGLPRITFQLHFAFEFDARNEDDWTSKQYITDDTWHTLAPDEIRLNSLPLHPRPVDSVIIKQRIPAKIIAQGLFKRDSENTDQPVSQMMYHDFLSTRLSSEIFENFSKEFSDKPLAIKPIAQRSTNSGIYAVIDLGAEQAGLFEIDIDASSGVVIDISYGEHLDDLRVRSIIGSRNFANRFITTAGRHKFTHYFTRFAGRYVQLHISNFDSVCKLYYAGLVAVEYPFKHRGKFESDCAIQKKIYHTAVDTLQLCAHEHYEDCPWREQALYANDARNQALSGYYCFGEYRMPFASFELLGRGINKQDGYLELCAPAKIPITIPSFSMAWVLAAKDYLMYSGDITGACSLYKIAQYMIGAWLNSMKDGLLPCPTGSRYWHFYDWKTGLDGTMQNDCTKFEVLNSLRYDASLNLLLCLALESAADMAKYCGTDQEQQAFRSHADALRTNIHEKFFNRKAGLYNTYGRDNDSTMPFAKLTQSLAVLAKTCSEECATFIRAQLIRNDTNMVETTLSQSFYKFEALLTDKSRYAQYVFKKIEDDWSHMLFQNATTFWETLEGGWDFDLAGSLCHGWSAIPVYFYQAHLSGVRPIEPGFRKFIVEPSNIAIDTNAIIPTPHGNINVKTTRGDEKISCDIDYPSPLIPVISQQNQDGCGINVKARASK
jgi:hypothetical protein